MAVVTEKSVLGLDIGGANLKAAHLRGVARLVPFAVWKKPHELPLAISELLKQMPAFDLLAMTMTAELCDCFETKRQGVAAVLDAVEQAAVSIGTGPVWVWQTAGRFVNPAQAREEPFQAAASNWRSLAEYAGRFCTDGRALLIDVGSTTTDIVPIVDGRPVSQGWSDPERLVASELVYSGVRRTPVCAVVSHVPWRGAWCPVAAEWFATTGDVHLLLGDLTENPDDVETADGRPATQRCAHDRLARVICGDREMLDASEVQAIARHVAGAQLAQLRKALDTVLDRLGGAPETVVLAGEGEFLARRLIRQTFGRGEDDQPLSVPIVSLAEELGPGISRAACAFAVAKLAAEQCRASRDERREPALDSGPSTLDHL